MRVAYFDAERPLSLKIGRWLVQRGHKIVATSGPPDVGFIKHYKPDIGVSVLYRHKIPPDVLALFPRGVVNLHPSYLPWNRGAMPNVWPIIDGSPAGVTLHWMDAGIDTGDIIAQRRVDVLPTDTGKTLYDRLMVAAYDLFVETWPSVVDGTAPRVKQPEGGSYHRSKDVGREDCLFSDRAPLDYTECVVVEVMNLLRARTFPPYRGCYYEEGGKRVYVRVELEEGTT